MLSKNEYIYSKRDLLEEPENYFFSEYDGINFVKLYFDNRINNIKLIENKVNNNKLKLKKTFNFNNEKFITKDLLMFIFYKADNELGDKEIYYINKLLKKYEVSKKIYSEYNWEFQNISFDYSIMLNYCLLSLICYKCYINNYNLKYLNVILKINDMICSNQKRIKNDEAYLFLISLRNEVSIIKRLYDKEGIIYDIE